MKEFLYSSNVLGDKVYVKCAMLSHSCTYSEQWVNRRSATSKHGRRNTDSL